MDQFKSRAFRMGVGGFIMTVDPEVWIVDRAEGMTFVLEGPSGRIQLVPRDLLPPGTTEGAVLLVERNGSGELNWVAAQLDAEGRSERLARGRKILDNLGSRDPGGDIAL
jgi:hypothetical protein